MADNQYKELELIGEWTSVNNKASAFIFPGAGGTTQSSIPVCRRCGKRHPGQKCSIPHWRDTPPSDGASDEKTINNRQYFWCQKCSRWNTSH